MPHFAKSCICRTRTMSNCRSRLSPPDAAQETAAAAISIASNGSIPAWLGELYLRLGPAVVFHFHAFFVRGQTIIRAHLLHHGGVAGGAAALGRLSGRRVAGFCAGWWWDIIFQAARTILVIVCAVQCGSSRLRELGEKLMRVSKGRPIGASAADKVVNKE